MGSYAGLAGLGWQGDEMCLAIATGHDDVLPVWGVGSIVGNATERLGEEFLAIGSIPDHDVAAVTAGQHAVSLLVEGDAIDVILMILQGLLEGSLERIE